MVSEDGVPCAEMTSARLAGACQLTLVAGIGTQQMSAERACWTRCPLYLGHLRPDPSLAHDSPLQRRLGNLCACVDGSLPRHGQLSAREIYCGSALAFAVAARQPRPQKVQIASERVSQLRNITADWGRAAKEWRMAMNQFAIRYEERFTHPAHGSGRSGG
jgi:hypothetical protein